MASKSHQHLALGAKLQAERDTLRAQLEEMVEAVNRLKRSTHGFNEAQWERVHAAVASSELALAAIH